MAMGVSHLEPCLSQVPALALSKGMMPQLNLTKVASARDGAKPAAVGNGLLRLELPPDGATEEKPSWLQEAFLAEPDSDLGMQLQNLSSLVGGEANTPQFLQEMMLLQMQAEGWRVQWSVAMQENEELRSRLYDTRTSLESAGGGWGDGDFEHWRELCVAIAKSAEDDKVKVVEQIASLRQELERTTSQVGALSIDKERFAEEAAVHRREADEWAAKADALIRERHETNTKLFHADSAATETEESTEHEAVAMREMKQKSELAERETDAIIEQLRQEQISYEARLTELYSSHRELVEALAIELSQNDEELQQGQSAMQQWRTQWEEELTEKNSIDAELLTLRSEFEKSSATYDREIEGLRLTLEKERKTGEAMKRSLLAEEEEVAAVQVL